MYNVKPLAVYTDVHLTLQHMNYTLTLPICILYYITTIVEILLHNPVRCMLYVLL